MALLANTDRHKSLLKTAFKRLKAHPERSSLFYVVVHRSNKNALLSLIRNQSKPSRSTM